MKCFVDHVLNNNISCKQLIYMTVICNTVGCRVAHPEINYPDQILVNVY